MSGDGVRLWRCAACGKWSHAKRRPKRHERPVEHPSVLDVVLRDERDYDHMNGDSGVVFVACGPFEGWTAVRDL